MWQDALKVKHGKRSVEILVNPGDLDGQEEFRIFFQFFPKMRKEQCLDIAEIDQKHGRQYS